MAKLSIGIVGLPNVGKSTLFNAITNSEVEAANYPFCTIDPHTGVVGIPDERLNVLAKISGSEKILPATIEFTDIAGLVKGAAQGEGLGNKFLSNIRDTSAIAHVVRCFDDPNVVHVHGKVDPIGDADIINLELILADLEMAQNSIANQERKVKSNDKVEVAKLDLLKKIKAQLEANQPVRSLELSDKEAEILTQYNFLSNKKVIYVANVAESELGKENAHTKALAEYAKASGDSMLIISAQIEAELSVLSDDEKTAFLADYGLKESGLGRLANACFDLLGLQTYLTTGPKETHAWTIRKGDKAPQAAGVIHTDFEKGFIRANVISFPDFVTCQGLKVAREKGLLRQEGKDYVMHDGDIVEFLFNV